MFSHRLLEKLRHYAVRGYLNNRIADFLADRQQEVVLAGVHFIATQVPSSVSQGTVLGPLLFLVYINDMPAGISSTVRLFADGSLVYRIIRFPDDQTILQEDLRKLEQWEDKWQMELNANKYEILPRRGTLSPVTTASMGNNCKSSSMPSI